MRVEHHPADGQRQTQQHDAGEAQKQANDQLHVTLAPERWTGALRAPAHVGSVIAIPISANAIRLAAGAIGKFAQRAGGRGPWRRRPPMGKLPAKSTSAWRNRQGG
ncbi:hypothetical protein Ms3S1_30520 [Methylosinus sp. 3S-1]